MNQGLFLNAFNIEELVYIQCSFHLLALALVHVWWGGFWGGCFFFPPGDASNSSLHVPACPSTPGLGEFTSLERGCRGSGGGDESGNARPPNSLPPSEELPSRPAQVSSLCPQSQAEYGFVQTASYHCLLTKVRGTVGQLN